MAWVLTFDGQVYREADLTIDEAEQVEIRTNTSWRHLNPLRSAGAARALTEVLLVSKGGLTPEDAKAKVGAMKVNDWLDCLSTEDDDADLPTEFADGFPPGAAESSTDT